MLTLREADGAPPQRWCAGEPRILGEGAAALPASWDGWRPARWL